MASEFSRVLVTDPTSSDINPRFLLDPERAFILSKPLLAGSATTWQTLKSGQVMGKVTASDLYRPCGKVTLTAASAASTTATVGTNQIRQLVAGDTISVVSQENVAGSVVFDDVGGSGHDITVTGTKFDGIAHKVAFVDPSAVSKPLNTVLTLASGVYTLTVNLATDGGGSITTTVAQAVEIINYHHDLFFATVSEGDGSGTMTAVAATALAGAKAVGVALYTGVSVSSVNLSAGTMVLGTAITAAIGDSLQTTDGSQTAQGILKDGRVLFVVNDAGTLSFDQYGGKVIFRGIVRGTDDNSNKYVLGDNSLIRSDLAHNIQFIDEP